MTVYQWVLAHAVQVTLAAILVGLWVILLWEGRRLS